MEINHNSKNDLKKLLKIQLPLEDLLITSKNSAEIILNSHDIEKLNTIGLQYKIIVHDMEKSYIEKQHNDTYNRSDDYKILRDANISNYPYGTYGGYHKLAELELLFDSLSSEHPSLMSSKFSIGKSHNGKDIWAYKLSDNVVDDESSNEKVAYYDALHHAREMNSLPSLIFFTIWLLENYNSAPLATYILNNRELYFVPTVNPDGYYFNEVNYPDGGGMWRKNRRNNEDGSIGVDINRNYSYGYGLDNGSASWGSSETYRGPYEFSEPEAVAIRDFIDSIKPVTANIIHTKAGRYLIPYTYSDETPDYEIYSELTIGAADENDYIYGNCKQILDYYSSGTTIDYLHSKGIYCWLPELKGTDFWAPKSEILPVASENLKFNQMIALAAGSYPMYHSIVAQDKSAEGKKELALKVNVKNRGLSVSTTEVTVKLSSLTSNISIFPENQTISSISKHVIKPTPNDFVVNYSLLETVPSNLFIIVHILENNAEISTDTVIFTAGETNILFDDNGENGLINWTNNGTWDTTSLTSNKGNTGFTDSRNGNCSNNMNSTLTLKNAINLSGTLHPVLSFNAKWSSEKNYDGTNIQISTDNGFNWNTLEGIYTSSVNGTKGYTGTNDWVNEVINLSNYIGDEILLRFKSSTNYSTSVDGFYFDNILIADYKDFQTENFVNIKNNHSMPLKYQFENGIIKLQGIISNEEDLALSIYDLKGRNIYREKWQNNKSTYFNEKILISDKLSSGYYISKFQYGKKQIVKSIVIK